MLSLVLSAVLRTVLCYLFLSSDPLLYKILFKRRQSFRTVVPSLTITPYPKHLILNTVRLVLE